VFLLRRKRLEDTMARAHRSLALGLALLLAGCASPTPAPPSATAEAPKAPAATTAPKPAAATAAAKPSGKDTLAVAIPSDIDNFDPPKSFGVPKQELSYNVYEQLVDFKLKDQPNGLKVSDGDAWAPSLAEQVDVGPDGVTYTFHLRKGVRFYPSGRELAAEDVRWSLERQLALTVGFGKFEANEASIFEPSQLQVVDPLTVRLTTRGHNPATLAFMRFIQFAVFDSQEVKAHSTPDDPWAEKWLAEHTAGTGPYYVESRNPGVEIVLARNPYYWGPPPAFQRVVLRILGSKADRLLLIASGAVDVDTYLGAEEIAALRRQPGVTVLSEPSVKRIHLNLRVDQPPFDDVRVRKALAYAVPYDQIIKTAYFGAARRMYSMVTEGTPGYDGSVRYDYDLEKARPLLAEAGKGDGLATSIFYDSGVPEHQSVAVLLQAELAKLKINAAIQGLPTAQFQSRRQNRDLAGIILGQGSLWLDDPATVVNLWYRSKGFANYSKYENPRVDAIYDQWAFSSDREGRARAFADVQRIVADDAALIPVASANHNVAMRDNLAGYVYYIDFLTRFRFLAPKG